MGATEEKTEEKEDVKMEEPEEVVELTEEEKAVCFRKLDSPDLTEKALTASFADFSLPTTAEGFDSINFAWQQEAACASFLKDWILQKKLTSRVDNIVPGDSCKEAWSK